MRTPKIINRLPLKVVLTLKSEQIDISKISFGVVFVEYQLTPYTFQKKEFQSTFINQLSLCQTPALFLNDMTTFPKHMTIIKLFIPNENTALAHGTLNRGNSCAMLAKYYRLIMCRVA